MAERQAPGRGPALVVGGVLTLAAALVAYWEGYRPEPYRDIVGVLTVCYGHTGSDVVAGKRYTRAECDALLRRDLAEAKSLVRRCITRPMPEPVEAALTSAAYNVGPRIVCGSTLQRKAQAGDWAGTCAELSRWVYAGGQRVRGLVNRRAAERALCESYR